MLLTISTTYQPATDLGFLLHKHPARVQSDDFAFGRPKLIEVKTAARLKGPVGQGGA